ncbi:hypothetical protein Tco_0954263 [Tanacetum coccineum]|uniref:Uncharacterized protein n=1 Tax=Tanacetum coccineum TaxID=301880 RepID=A0ABQ5E2H3_9ASTR
MVEGKEKRAGTELAQEITKKQKVEDDKETSKIKKLMEIIPDEEEIYMLVEKKYPLTPSTLLMILEKKIMINYEIEMAYQLLKFIVKQLKKKPKRKDTQIPQSSDPSDNVANEAVHKELGDSLVRAATTASSLEAKCQETMGDIIAQTRSENVSKHSNDSLLAEGNTLRSDEDALKLNELMELCTNLQKRVLDLEKTKTTQANEIASLKRRLDADKEMFDVDALDGEEVFVAGQNENVVEEVVDAAQVSTAATTVTITTEEIILAQPGESTTTKSTPTISSQQSQDKGKEIMIEEPVKPIKKKDLIRLDEEVALKLQAEFDEEERLAREKAKKEKEANIALIETWDDIQAKINVDYQLAKRLQAQEQEELSNAEKATLFKQLLEKRRKHFAAKRA